MGTSELSKPTVLKKALSFSAIFSFKKLISLIFGLDRFSKIKILNNFSDNTYFVSNYINLDLIWNTGIGFGLLSSDSIIIYSVITIIIFLVILILFYLAAVSRKLDNIIFSIIIGLRT